ncbi:MAG: hypothetical protein V1838_05855 [Patescibacteria group bacterium]
MARKRIDEVPDHRINDIERAIVNSSDAGELTKKVCLMILWQTENLTVPSYMFIPPITEQGERIDHMIGKEVHHIGSSSGQTKILDLFQSLGTAFALCSHCGQWHDGKRIGEGYTVWIGEVTGASKGKRLEFIREEIEAIDLS